MYGATAYHVSYFFMLTLLYLLLVVYRRYGSHFYNEFTMRLIERNVGVKKEVNSRFFHMFRRRSSANDSKPKIQLSSFKRFSELARRYVSFTLLYLAARLLLFIWIFCFFSIPSSIICIWLMYSILELLSETAMESISFTILPIMCLQALASYIVTVLDIDDYQIFGARKLDSFYPNYLLMVTTIILFLYLRNQMDYYKRKLLKAQTNLTDNLLGLILL